MWIKFYPYTLERFSHVSPAGVPTALCCQRNEVTGLSQSHRTQRGREKKKKIPPSLLDLFRDLSLITGLVATSRLKQHLYISTWCVQSSGALTVLFTLSCIQKEKKVN